MIDVDSYPIYITEGKDFAFYHNSDDASNDSSFSDWQLQLVHCDTFIPVVNDIATINQDFVDAPDNVFYRWYVDFEWPAIPDGVYRLIVEDTVADEVKFISNVINVKATLPSDVVYLKYRNSKNYLNIGYERITDFYNKFYTKLEYINPLDVTNSVGYDLIDGAFNRVRTTTGKTKDFYTINYNEDDHAAFNAATTHSDFFIIEEGNFIQYKRGDSDYSIEWQDTNPFYPLADGNVTLQRDDKYKSGKAL